MVVEYWKPTEVSFVSVESRREAVYITRSIGAAPTACNSGEADKNRSLFAFTSEERGRSEIRPIAVRRKYSVRSDATSVNRTFRNL